MSEANSTNPDRSDPNRTRTGPVPTRDQLRSDQPTPELAELARPEIGYGFELRGLIGKGGMGVVYRAWDRNLDREVAVKVLQEKFAPESITAVRFITEAKITARLQHPGIPPVYHVAKLVDGRPFLAMKLIQGATLETLLREGQCPNKLAVFEAICQAVGYAHAHSMIHRDLKPANIMVGAFGEVQVMDWGLAKVLATGGYQSTYSEPNPSPPNAGPRIRTLGDPNSDVTQEGSVMGTPAYMPPEQANGESERIDQRSDVFGLGAILCELLTGQPPYRGADTQSVYLNAVEWNTREAFDLLASCGAEPGLVELCQRCLAKDPAGRPANAGAVEAAVSKLRNDAEDRAKQAELAQAKAQIQATEQRKRRRVVQVGSSLIALVLLVGIAISSRQAYRAWQAEAATAVQLIKTDEAKQEAIQNSDKARKNVLKLLDSANQMAFDITSQLESTPRTQAVRQALLRNARASLSEVLEDARTIGTPDRTLILTYLRMGDIESELGNIDRSVAEYTKAKTLAEELHQQDANNADCRRDVAIASERLGNVLYKLGNVQETLQLYTKAFELHQLNSQQMPTSPNVVRDVSVSHGKLGDIYMQLGDFTKAYTHLSQQFDIRKRLLDEDPKSVQARRDILYAVGRLCEVLMRQAKPKEALKLLEAYRHIDQQLANESLPDATSQDLSSNTLLKFGEVYYQLAEDAEAGKYFERARQIRQEMAKADPSNTSCQRDLAFVDVRLADTQMIMGDFQEAKRTLEEAQSLLGKLILIDPKNKAAKRDLAVCSSKLGDANRYLKNLEESLKGFQFALEQFQELARIDPKWTPIQTDIAIAYLKLGMVETDLFHFDQAREMFGKCREQVTKLARENRLSLVQKNNWPRMVQQALDQCDLQEKAIADLDYLFEQTAEQIVELVRVRVNYYLRKQQPQEALKTAERFAEWVEVETMKQKRDELRCQAVSALALCVGAVPAEQDRVVNLMVSRLKLARSSGYLTEKLAQQIRQSPDIAAIGEHPKLAAFFGEILKPRELAPLPRPGR